MFKKPIDPMKKNSKEEEEEKLKKVRDLNLTKEEENALIWMAIKRIFLPVFVVLMLVLAIVFILT